MYFGSPSSNGTEHKSTIGNIRLLQIGRHRKLAGVSEKLKSRTLVYLELIDKINDPGRSLDREKGGYA